MRANDYRLPQTQPDLLRMFAQLRGSPLELSPTVTDLENRTELP